MFRLLTWSHGYGYRREFQLAHRFLTRRCNLECVAGSSSYQVYIIVQQISKLEMFLSSDATRQYHTSPGFTLSLRRHAAGLLYVLHLLSRQDKYTWIGSGKRRSVKSTRGSESDRSFRLALNVTARKGSGRSAFGVKTPARNPCCLTNRRVLVRLESGRMVR